jgi:hypothetical protein
MSDIPVIGNKRETKEYVLFEESHLLNPNIFAQVYLFRTM